MIQLDRRLLGMFMGAFVLAGLNLSGLGPAEDHSKFISAKLVLDGRAVVFYNRLVYRPAVGWRAFPDGGIPSYLADRKLIGLYDLTTRTTKVIHREDNRDWCPGDGNFNIYAACGAKAVVIAGGQRRQDLRNEVRYYWLDLPGGKLTPLPLVKELAGVGRGLGYFYLVRPDGSLVLVTPPQNTPVGEHWSRDPARAEIWLRKPGGAYVRLASGVEYHGCLDNELYYWDLVDRTDKAYSLGTGVVRYLTRPALFPGERTAMDAAATWDGRALELRRKSGEAWQSEKLGLDMTVLNS